MARPIDMSDDTFCAACSTRIEVDCDEAGVRLPCPSCGAFHRTFEVSIVETLGVLDGTGMNLKRPGIKKPVIEQFDKPSYSYSRKEYVRHVRVIDREGDKYLETVTPYGSHEPIHHCAESLSQHVGHGSAKKAERVGSDNAPDYRASETKAAGLDDGASNEP